MKVRPYQERTLARIRTYVARSATASASAVRAALVLAATGSGKTLVELQTLRDNGGGICVVPSIETLQQHIRVFSSLFPQERKFIGVEQSNTATTTKTTRYVFTTMATLGRRTEDIFTRLGTPPRVVVIDEAHHFGSEQRRDILDRLSALRVPVIGFTATFDHSDKRQVELLHEYFPEMLDIYTLSECMREGWVPNFTPYDVVSETKIGAVPRSSTGDFSARPLEIAVNNEERNRRILHAYDTIVRPQSQGRPCLVFCAGVEHAAEVARVAEGDGFRSSSISHLTPLDQRKDLFARIERGEIDMVCVYNIALEGLDVPGGIGGVIFARPTSCDHILAQALGRLLRHHASPAREESLASSSTLLRRLHFGLQQGARPFVSIVDSDIFTLRQSLARVNSIIGLPPRVIADGSIDALSAFMVSPVAWATVPDFGKERSAKSVAQTFQQLLQLGPLLQMSLTESRDRERSSLPQELQSSSFLWEQFEANQWATILYEPTPDGRRLIPHIFSIVSEGGALVLMRDTVGSRGATERFVEGYGLSFETLCDTIQTFCDERSCTKELTENVYREIRTLLHHSERIDAPSVTDRFLSLLCARSTMQIIHALRLAEYPLVADGSVLEAAQTRGQFSHRLEQSTEGVSRALDPLTALEREAMLLDPHYSLMSFGGRRDESPTKNNEAEFFTSLQRTLEELFFESSDDRDSRGLLQALRENSRTDILE